MSQEITTAIVSAIFGAIFGALGGALSGVFVARYNLKISGGKLQILGDVVLFSEGGHGAYIEAVLVNKGREPVIIDYVLLRDEYGKEHEKKHPGFDLKLGYIPLTLSQQERHEAQFKLSHIQAPRLIKQFEAIDTLGNVYKKALTSKTREQLRDWEKAHES